MIIIRFAEIILKLTLCLSFKKYKAVRILLLPVHLIFVPHLLFMHYHKRMVFCLESLGAVFIKLGQSLSLKSFLFSKDTIKSLSYLQDSISPMKINIRVYLKQICPKILECEHFTIKDESIASASIAQVHLGFLNGTKVAVKILRKDIGKKIKRDFKIVFFLVRIVNIFCPPALRIIEVTQDIYSNILKEIDLTNEMANIRQIKRNIILDGVHVPSVFPEYSNSKVLVMSFVEGLSLREIIHGDGDVFDKNLIAENIVQTYLNQVYRDGIFHADMHSGNIFANKDGTISLVDFGLISQISIKDRRAVATMIYGFTHKNPEVVLHAQLSAGYITNDIFYNIEYRNAISDLTKNFDGGFKMSSFAKELFSLMNRFNVFVPKHLLMLNKTILYVEDITKQLCDGFDPVKITGPWIRKWYYKEKILMFCEKILHIK